MSEPASPPTAKRLLIDTLDGESLALRLLRLLEYADDNPAGASRVDLEKVRAFPQRKYSEREGAWLVPLTDPNVEYLTNNWEPATWELTDAARVMLDYHLKTRAVADVKLQERLAYLQDQAVVEPEGYLYATQPHGHQTIAFSSARTAEYFALLMEMGTGKSKVVVDVICDRARRARVEWERGGRNGPAPQLRALVVAPKTVTHNWLLELQKHATVDLAVDRLRGGKLRRVQALVGLLREREAPAIVAVTNYEGLEAIEEALNKVQWDLMVCDESIWIKNPETRRARAAYRLAECARSRFILTGLPITKNILDLYGQFHFLKPGSLGFTSFYAYQNYYGEKNHWGGFASWKRDKLPELQERLARFSFVIRRSQCLDLPAKMYQTLEIEMADDQRAAYEQMLEDMIVDLDQLDRPAAAEAVDDGDEANAAVADLFDQAAGAGAVGNQRFATARIILVKLLRLAQITSGFVKKVDGTIHRFSSNPKVEALEELLEELGPEDKVIVWSRFVEDIRLVSERLAKYGVAPFYGGLSDAARERNLERFKTDPRCRVFVGQPQSGGFGINLTEANHCVYFSNDFSLQTRSQSEDRCHRIGQTRNVLYTDLVVPTSIDSLILERLKTKRDLADLLTDRKKIADALRAQLAAVRRDDK